MNHQIPDGNFVNPIYILSFLLIVSIISLFMLFFHHLRYKKEMSEKLSRAGKEIETQNYNFGVFMTNLSREIRTHMIGILGNDEIILRESPDNTVRKQAVSIRSSAEDVISLSQGVIDFMRFSAGNVESLIKEYDFASLIVDIVTTVSPPLKSRDIVLNVSADRNCPRNQIGDPYKIKTALLNLFSFIEKNIDNKGIAELVIGFDNSAGKSGVVFKVICTGLSCDDDRVKSCLLLAPSENNYNFSKNEQGFFELFLCGAFVHFMKSSLTFEEADDKKIFSFSIPVMLKDDEIIGDIRDVGNNKSITNYGKIRKINVFAAKILLIDDTSDNVSFFKKILGSLGADLSIAGDSKEALKLIQENEFDMFFVREGVKDSKDCEIIRRIRGGLINPLNSKKPCICLCYDSFPDTSGDVHIKYDSILSVPVAPGDIEDILIKYLPKNKYQITNDIGIYPQIHGVEDIRRYSEGYEDLYRNALGLYKRAANYRDSEKR